MADRTWSLVGAFVLFSACSDEEARKANSVEVAELQSVSLGYETRDALVFDDGTTKTFDIALPDTAALRFAIATPRGAGATTFRLSVDGEPVFEKTLRPNDTEHWWDQTPIDLSAWAGASALLSFETNGPALWGRPFVAAGVLEAPDIILISIDCLRADHVGVYGYEKPTTPAIDAFAAQAVVFEHAVSASSWTIPSHMSMFTGLPPMVHGVSDSPDDFWAGRAETLAPTVPVLAEILRQTGYETAGVVSSAPMSPRYGFQRGFDVYRVHAAKAEEVVDSAIDRLARGGGRPQFLFVHFIDPHWPYMPMVEFRSYAAEFIERFGERPKDLSELIARHQGKALRARPEDAASIRTLYDAAIAYADRELGRLFAHLKEAGRYDDALILITGDHGEAFYDHETYGHAKTLYQELTHVPLVVKFPGEVQGARQTAPVSHVDIFATVLAAAGIEPPPMEGIRLDEVGAGRSLVLDVSWQDREREETWISVRRDHFKYIAVLPLAPPDELSLSDVIREELYDLSSDPRETTNLADDPPTGLVPFRDRVKTYVEAARAYRSQHDGTAISIDEDMKRRLEALGYITR